MAKNLGKYPRAAYRLVELVDMTTEAAKQAKKQFGVDVVPFVVLYDPKGNVLWKKGGVTFSEILPFLEKYGK